MRLRQYFKRHERLGVLVTSILFGLAVLPIILITGLITTAPLSLGRPETVMLLIGGIGLLIVSAPYLVWKRCGVEKDAHELRYLHTIPDKKLAPWQVEVLMDGDFGKNGMASVLLELDMAKAMKSVGKKAIAGSEEVIVFKVSRDFSEIRMSSMARKLGDRVMCYLKKETKDSYICEYPYASIKERIFIEAYYDDWNIRDFSSNIRNHTGSSIMLVVFGIAFVLDFLWLALGNGWPFIVPALCAMMGWLFVRLVVRDVFSKYNEEYHQQYLDWLAFKRMLQDYAKIGRYGKKDKEQWKEWLLYATALGVAVKVNESYPELEGLAEYFVVNPSVEREPNAA